jgi:hypothetical protein
MQQAQSHTGSRRWIGRGALVALAGLALFGVSPALPALAASWSSPVPLCQTPVRHEDEVNLCDQ